LRRSLEVALRASHRSSVEQWYATSDTFYQTRQKNSSQSQESRSDPLQRSPIKTFQLFYWGPALPNVVPVDLTGKDQSKEDQRTWEYHWIWKPVDIFESLCTYA
jgi:hypothetical protein